MVSDEKAVRLGESVKKFNSLVRTNKVKMRLSMNSQIKVKIEGPKQFLDDIKLVEDDLKKMLKITDITYGESEQINAEITPV